MEKTIILILFFSFICPSFVFAQDLELEYPAVPEADIIPQTIDTPINQYIQYIYYFFLAIAGIIGLLVIVYAGVQYLASTGDPGKIQDSKKRIFAALFGLLILGLSYVILFNINPDLVNLEIPNPEQIIIDPLESPPLETKTPNLLANVENLAERIRSAAQAVKDLSGDLRNSFLQCNCLNSKSLCWCTGGQDSDTCEPHQCYGGDDHHPCRDYEDMKKNLLLITAWKDELLYYRNRAAAEIKDLEDEIALVLPKKIERYQDLLAAEIDPAARAYIQEKINLVQQEIGLKQSLIQTLRQVGNKPDRDKDEEKDNDFIKEIAKYIAKFPPLLDKCIEDEEGKHGLNIACKAECIHLPSNSFDKGPCHDTIFGCQGAPCMPKEGIGNPCPLDDVMELYLYIDPLTSLIISNSNQIIGIIESLRSLKSFTTI